MYLKRFLRPGLILNFTPGFNLLKSIYENLAYIECTPINKSVTITIIRIQYYVYVNDIETSFILELYIIH